MNTITYPQLEVAHRLAIAFGHEWGAYPVPEYQEYSEVTPDVIRAWMEATSSNSMPGIRAPFQEADGCLSHESGTGRLFWKIDAHGRMSFEISRPQGVALVGEFYAGHYLPGGASQPWPLQEMGKDWPGIVLEEHSSDFYCRTNRIPIGMRHVEAVASLIEPWYRDRDGTREEWEEVKRGLLETLYSVALPDPCSPWDQWGQKIPGRWGEDPVWAGWVQEWVDYVLGHSESPTLAELYRSGTLSAHEQWVLFSALEKQAEY